jgi:two-component system, sensor histidine kinase
VSLTLDSGGAIQTHNITVLLIDDQAMIGEAVRRMLVDEKDIIFHFCNDPARAISIASEVSPTVILVDLVMPEIDGLTLVRFFRASPLTRDIPIIVLSTTEDPKVKASAFAKEANDYLVKLPDRLELVARIRHHSKGYINLLDKNAAFKALLESQKALEKAKEQAVAATRAKSDFLACMSHDIRTPMNAIIGMSDVLSETELTTDQMQYVRVLRSAGETLLALINDILDFSKIEAGQLHLEKIALKLRELVSDTVDIAKVRAKEKGLEIETAIDENVPNAVLGDPTRIRQILINLLSNAIKFTEKGKVTVRIAREKDVSEGTRLLFSVADTGIGIPHDKQTVLFQKFMQVDSSMTRKYGGTGLGLAICRQLCEMMDGRIWVESAGGSGSVFHFTLVVGLNTDADAGKSIAATEAKPVVESAPVAPLRILLVDDMPENRMLIQTYLKKTPHQIEIAENGDAALSRFKEKACDLVLMDMQMPVMDGYTATREIRKWELANGKAPTPVVALTSHAMAEDAKKSVDAGCNDHVVKPIRKALLLEVIAKYAPKAQ